MSIVLSIRNLLFKAWKKQAVLHHTFDHMLEGIQIHDFNWRYLYVNNALVKYSQYSKEELLGNTLMDKYPGIEKSDLFKVMDRCMRERRSEHFETEFTFPDGSKADFELSIQPVPEGLFILSINITDRKRAEENQKTSETYYRSVFEQANDIIYIVDSSSKPKFIDVNQSGCELLGYSKDEFLHLNIFDIIFENDVADSKATMDDLRTGRSLRKERKLRKKDGTAIMAELSAKKMEDGNIMVVARDISERKKVEDVLQKSEIRFRTLIENNNDIISLMDESFKVIYRSPSAAKILGWADEEIKGIDGTDNIHPEDRAHTKQVIQDLFKNKGKAYHTTFRTKHKNGHYLWLEGTVINLLHNENLNAIVFNYRDITEQRKAQEEVKKLNENLEIRIAERTHELEKNIIALTESEEKFQKIFQASAAGISITRLSDATYTDVNTAFEEITGFSKKEVVGHTSQELGMITNFSKRDELLKDIRQMGSAKNYEMNIRIKSGAILSMLIAVETIHLKGEEYNITIIYDISERKKMEEQLVLANKELEAFSYSVSHDLRAPLRAVNGYAQLLNEEYNAKLDESAQRILGLIKSNAVKMGTLIDDLLDFSRLGRKDVKKAAIDFNDLVADAITELDKSISDKIKIKIAKLPTLKGDYTLLKQVVINLVSNAIKYSSNKEQSLIEIYSEDINEETVISVKDNGAGFDMKYVHKLFGVFQRLHSGEEFEGTGVGLAIVQRIIEKHGGKVWAEGKINEGAIFHFTLPKN